MQKAQSKPRNKELTNIQMQRLRKQPQYLKLNDNQFVLYNLVEKQSNSGLFKNERLLIINTKQQSICYLSKVPPSLIPFQNEGEVSNQQPKQKLSSHETYQNGENKLSCRMVPEKNGIQIKVNKNDRKIEWIYYFFNKQLMEEWYSHVSFIFTNSRHEIDERYHKKIKQNIIEEQHIHERQDQMMPLNQPQQSEVINQYKSKHEQTQLYNRNLKTKIEEIKQPNEQKQSQFNDFSQNAPLGRFVRQNRKYNTQKDSDNNRAGTIYNTPFQSENLVKNNEYRPVHLTKQELQDLPNIKSNIQSLNNEHLASSISKKSQKNISDSRNFYQEGISAMSFRKKANTIKQVDWNTLYYSSKDSKSKFYFDFLNQCIKYTTSLVDRLPSSKQIEQFERIENYYLHKDNGIVYKIAYGRQQSSLIYQLSQNTPIVCDNYDIYDDLKAQFFEERQLFFKNHDQQPSLVCFIDYKGLSFLCKASKFENSFTKSNKSFKRSNVNEDVLLKKLENLQLFIVSASDYHDIMRYLNTPTLNWSYLYLQTQIKPFKVQFLNEMFSDIFINILKGQLCHMYNSNLFDQLRQMNLQIIQQAVSDSILMLVNRLFGKGQESNALWDIIINEVQRKYKIVTTMDSILPGYLLYSVIYKLGIIIKKNISMKTTFILFKNNKSIDKQYVDGFKPIVYCLNYQQMSSLFQQIKENLQSSQQNNEQLQMLINNQQYENIPALVNYLAPKVNIQLSKTKPYTSNGQSILIYQSMISDTPAQNNYEIVLSAISWLLQAERHNQAFDLAFIKIQELIFWTGKVPIISLFYDGFADYFKAHDDLQKVNEQIKLSIKILSQIFGANSIKLLRKKFDVSSHFLSMNRKDQSLKELNQCKLICENNKYQDSPIYIKILTKMTKLNLSMSKFNESIALSMISLKRLQSKVEDQHIYLSQVAACEFLQVGELLLRSFELTNRRQELFEVISLCAERCQNVDSIKAYKRLYRIILFPYLKRMSLKESQMYLMMVQQLNVAFKQSNLREQQLYECIQERRMLVDANNKMKNYFKNIVKLHDEVIKKKLLQEYLYNEDEYFLGKVDHNQVEQFLKQTFLITNLIGIGFVQGMLKDIYYD